LQLDNLLFGEVVALRLLARPGVAVADLLVEVAFMSAGLLVTADAGHRRDRARPGVDFGEIGGGLLRFRDRHHELDLDRVIHPADRRRLVPAVALLPALDRGARDRLAAVA